MVTYNPPLFSSDALLKYLNPVPANPGPPVADISISALPSDSAASTSLPSTSAPPSDSASVYEKAPSLDPADWPSILNEKKDFKLIKEGLKDWKNASHLLKVHEDSHEHNTNMATWKELEVRLAKGLTIDKLEMTLAEAERNRIVSLEEKLPQIKEHFMGFLVAEESTGESLSALILKRLEELNIPFEDCRGQSYD
ncbi:zinc finger MYM-type protein 1-like isoform X1, partial [Tachysurus ichikawai]